MPRKTQARAPLAPFLGLAAVSVFIIAAGWNPAWAAEATAAAPATPPAGPTYDFRNPPQGVFDDEWMEIFIDGQKVGYAHEFFRREGDRVFYQGHEEFRVKRLSFELSATSDSTSEETLDGTPISFHSVTDMSDQPVIVDGHSDGKTFTITKTVGSFHDTQPVTFPAGTVMAWGQERLSRLKGLAPGTTYSFRSYDPSDDAFTALPTRVNIGALEKVQIHGQDVMASHVDSQVSSQDGQGSVDTLSWVDAHCDTVKMSVDMGGLSMDMIKSTAAEAKGSFVAKDIFSASLLALDQAVPAGAQSVTFQLHRADGKPLPLPPESSTEHGVQLPDGGVAITLKRAPKPAQSNTPLGAGLPDIAPYLARNSFLDTSDPLLRKLADEAGGPDNTDPVAVAWQLRDFVADYINKKDLSVGFATASQAAQSREGDCTEHAVLLAALGRVRGLPTRTVSGLVYLPVYDGEKNVLGFHMWAQFYFNGKWMDFDSALTDGAEPYWRMGLVASDLDEVSLSDFTLELMRWMAELKITVTAVDMPAKS